MPQNPPMDMFFKQLLTAPKDRQFAAVKSALALLAGKPPDRMLLTGAEFARQGSFSTMTLWRMVKSGAITPVKIRGSTRYRFSDLLKLAAGEVKS